MEICRKKRKLKRMSSGQYLVIEGDSKLPPTRDEIYEHEHERRSKKFRNLRATTVELTPFDAEPSGAVFLLLHDALNLKAKTWYQSPHWDHEPSTEEKEREQEYFEEAEEAGEQLEYVAAQIFYALTGKEPHIESKPSD
jgi:hypothetical protein